MLTRTRKTSVTFANAFRLGDRDEVFGPGTYALETDEELLEGLTFTAFRRTQVSICIPDVSGRTATSRTLLLAPQQLDTAIKRDRIADGASGNVITALASAGTLPKAESVQIENAHNLARRQ